jgi:hypothetical protein
MSSSNPGCESAWGYICGDISVLLRSMEAPLRPPRWSAMIGTGRFEKKLNCSETTSQRLIAGFPIAYLTFPNTRLHIDLDPPSWKVAYPLCCLADNIANGRSSHVSPCTLGVLLNVSERLTVMTTYDSHPSHPALMEMLELAICDSVRVDYSDSTSQRQSLTMTRL